MIEKKQSPKTLSEIECYITTNINGKDYKLLIDLANTRIVIKHPTEPENMCMDQCYYLAQLLKYFMGRETNVVYCFLDEETTNLIRCFQTPYEEYLEKEQEKYFEWKRKNKIIN